MTDDSRKELDEAYEGLEKEAPDSVSRAIRWLRDPNARWVRVPLGVLLVLGGLVGPFVPVLGIELLPLGLLLLAEDVPFLRKPVARSTLWLEHKWVALRGWWRARRQ